MKTSKNGNKGINNKSTETPNVIVRKVKKAKTPEGHYRLNGKFFPVRDVEIQKKIFCNKCHAENAVVIGSFRDDKGNTNYIVRCPHHPDDRYHLDETQFRLRFPGVLPEQSKEALFGADGLPTVRSYCRECRGTTGNVVGETPTHWEIKCQCGQHWTENKRAFARKYLGVDGQAPEFIQREPTVIEHNWRDDANGEEIRQMQDMLKDFNSKRKSQEFPLAVPVAEKSEEKVEANANAVAKTDSEVETKAEAKVKAEEEPKAQVTFEVAGIVISFLEGMSVTVDRINGKVHVVVR